MSRYLGNILTPNVGLAKQLFGNAYNIVSDEKDLDKGIPTIKVDANGKAELKNDSVYESVFGKPNPNHGNPYEINDVEADTELELYAVHKGISLFRIMMEDEVLRQDKVFPMYCFPSIMPLIMGSRALRELTDAWRKKVRNSEDVTYDTVIEEAKKHLQEVDDEVIDGIMEYINGQTQEELQHLMTRDEAKMIMLTARIQDLIATVPYCFLHEGIDVRNAIELDKFLNDFDSMYRFFINLDFIKDCVKRVTGTLEGVTNCYDYSL